MLCCSSRKCRLRGLVKFTLRHLDGCGNTLSLVLHVAHHVVVAMSVVAVGFSVRHFSYFAEAILLLLGFLRGVVFGRACTGKRRGTYFCVRRLLWSGRSGAFNVCLTVDRFFSSSSSSSRFFLPSSSSSSRRRRRPSLLVGAPPPKICTLFFLCRQGVVLLHRIYKVRWQMYAR